MLKYALIFVVTLQHRTLYFIIIGQPLCPVVERKPQHAISTVTEWLRAWDTLPMFEATACGRS